MKKFEKAISLLLITFLFTQIGCKKDILQVETRDLYPTISSLDDLVTDSTFCYRTTNEINFQIQLNAPDGNPIDGIPVHIGYMLNNEIVPLFTIISDANGLAEGLFAIPDDVNEVIVSPNYVGLPNEIALPVNGSLVSLNLSGARLEAPNSAGIPTTNQNEIASTQATNTVLRYKYLSTYNNQGVPSVMAGRDLITTSMLDYINNSLPERQPVATHHPAYLQQNLNTDIDITQLAEVWLTFVHEGAGYRNSLGFYKYSTNNPPASSSAIDTVYMAFPNASYYNSGGGLRSGDKVKIGTFQPGTSIGFVCISNGWTGSEVGDGYSRLFSDKNINPVAELSLKQHSVLLYDNVNQLYYLGFEDIPRDNGSCDNDFNDIVFYAKSNPITAISAVNVPLADNKVDTDNDGISDLYDEFPTDNSLAYTNYLPSPNDFGTLAFEDLWPSKGDYDFNDLVLGYQFVQRVNAQNKVKDMKCKFVIRAVGAHYKHGFGFQMNVASSAITNVTGKRIFGNYINFGSNNAEANQDKATIIAFDSDYGVVNRAEGNAMNTEISKAYQNPDTVTLNVIFNSPKTQAELGTAPYNPFIIVDGMRGKEVHLAGYKPTALANTSLFGTSNDKTNVSTGNTYKTKNNLPFGLHIPETFDYSMERSPINEGHLKFVIWAQSAGNLSKDWFKKINGNRNESKLFIKQ